jgi:hypothetical protein
MLPLPMNEYLQQALRDCFFDVELDVIEWNTLFTNWRIGAKDPTARGAHAVNITFAAMDPFFAFVRFVDSKMAPPTSNNWGFVNDPEFDRLVAAARTTQAHRRRDGVLVGGARRGPARDEPARPRLRAAAELVRRFLADHDELKGLAMRAPARVRIAASPTCSNISSNAFSTPFPSRWA